MSGQNDSTHIDDLPNGTNQENASMTMSVNENPTEYKPIGIDVLEKLISTLNKVSQNIDIEISQYNTQKPLMVDTLKTTPSLNNKYCPFMPISVPLKSGALLKFKLLTFSG